MICMVIKDLKNIVIVLRKKLEKFEINKLPLYIQNNLEKFKEWID